MNLNWPCHQPAYTRAYRLKRREKKPAKWLLEKARRHSKTGGHEYNLTEEDITIPTHCPILGMPLVLGSIAQEFSDSSPTIDRFDSSKGYVKGNVNVISWRANRLKSDGTLSEFRRLVEWMTKMNGSN